MTAAKIDPAGSLYINRAGKMKVQLCKHAVTGGSWGFSQVPCGDWCPDFDVILKARRGIYKGTYISICTKMLFFTEFEDERLQMREFDKILEPD